MLSLNTPVTEPDLAPSLVEKISQLEPSYIWIVLIVLFPLIHIIVLGWYRKKTNGRGHSSVLPKERIYNDLKTNSVKRPGQEREIQPINFTDSDQRLIAHKAINHLKENYPTRSAVHILSGTQCKIAFISILFTLTLVTFAPSLILPAFSSGYLAYCISLIFLRLWLLRESVTISGNIAASRTSDSPQSHPIITILIPLYREKKSVPYIHDAIERLSYPKQLLDVKLLLEENDPETLAAAKGHFCAEHYQIIIVPDGLPKKNRKRAISDFGSHAVNLL